MSVPGLPIIISNEPPPCESDEEEDQEDEYHSTGLNLDVLTDQSPFATPRKLPIPIVHNTEIEPDPEIQPSNISTTTNHKSPVIESIYVNGDCENAQSGSEQEDEEVLCVVKQEEVEDSEEVSLEEDFRKGYHDTNSAAESNSHANLCISNHEFQEEDSNFSTIAEEVEFKEEIGSEKIIEREDDLTIPENVSVDTGQTNQESQQNFEYDEEDDDFGDFGEFSAPAEPIVNPVMESVTFSESIEHSAQEPIGETGGVEDGPSFTANFDDEDFGDFESSEAKEVTSETKAEPYTPALELKRNFEPMIMSIFPKESSGNENNKPSSCPLDPLDKELIANPNSVWNHVNEFEDSRCLQFKWAESRIHQQLLISLNIDTSTVLYRGKWGAIEVPKFAADLVDIQGCLQPEVSFQSIQNETEDNGGSKSPSSPSKCTAEDDSPINEVPPDDVQRKKNSHLSREANRVLEQLPDLSYMRAKTLIFPRTPKY